MHHFSARKIKERNFANSDRRRSLKSLDFGQTKGWTLGTVKSNSKKKKKAESYARAGVDISAGDQLADWLAAKGSGAAKIQQDSGRLLSGIGGFASIYRLNSKNFASPCLVTCTDGVGTKVKLAVQFQRYREVAQDMVAMCVNDLICTGADPLLFLDYYATGKLNLHAAKEFLQGVKQACTASGCLLVGGETAEMPGVYRKEDFDCAGFAVGVVEERDLLGSSRVRNGDILLGVNSSGFHSNGFSLLRRLFARDMGKWIERLIQPTLLYPSLWKSLKSSQVKVHAMAHITGGGMENVPRVLPQRARIRWRPWDIPDLFREAQRRGKMSDQELRTTFNCGIGLVLVLPPDQMEAAQRVILRSGFSAQIIGTVEIKK